VVSVPWIRFLSGPVVDEMEPEAGPLAGAPDVGIGQPGRGHELQATELGQHSRVDLVGLGRQRGEALGLGGIGDLHLPAGSFQDVVDEPSTVHRLDRRRDRLAMARQPRREQAEGIVVRVDGRHLDRLPVLVEQVHVELLSGQVQSGV
jgi:hypothetical protein